MSVLENFSKMLFVPKGDKIKTVWLHLRVFVSFPSFIHPLIFAELLQCAGLICSFPRQSVPTGSPAQCTVVGTEEDISNDPTAS